MLLLRKYLIGSLIFHLLIVLISSLVALRTQSIKQTFVVFGACSGKPSTTTYKSSKISVPFVTPEKPKTLQPKKGSHTKQAVKKTVATKKAGIKKTPKKCTVSKKKSTSKIAPLKEITINKPSKKHEEKVQPKNKKQPPVDKNNKKILKQVQDDNLSKKQPKVIQAKENTKPIEEKQPTETKQKQLVQDDKMSKLQEELSVKEKTQALKEKQRAEEKKIKKQLQEEPLMPPACPSTCPLKLPERSRVGQSTEAYQEQDLGTIDVGSYDTEHVPLLRPGALQQGSQPSHKASAGTAGLKACSPAHGEERSVSNHEEQAEYQQVINQEAARVWRPPVGVPKGTTCFVTFTIARDGTHESDLTQKSPVIIYDLSVMRAARAMKFPKSLWGKQFKIAFHQ